MGLWYTMGALRPKARTVVMAAAAASSFKVLVSKLPNDISEEDMRTVFNTYGVVKEVEISRSGYGASAIVSYGDKFSADQAI